MSYLSCAGNPGIPSSRHPAYLQVDFFACWPSILRMLGLCVLETNLGSPWLIGDKLADTMLR